MIEQYIMLRASLMNVFLLVDSRHEPQKNDLDFMMWLGTQGLPFAIIFTKIDKMGTTIRQKNLAFYRKVLKKYWEELPPLFEVSNVQKTGGEAIIEYIRQINASAS